jgi:hypothetical protein
LSPRALFGLTKCQRFGGRGIRFAPAPIREIGKRPSVSVALCREMSAHGAAVRRECAVFFRRIAYFVVTNRALSFI